jgi:signal transduction histidine kinase
MFTALSDDQRQRVRALCQDEASSQQMCGLIDALILASIETEHREIDFMRDLLFSGSLELRTPLSVINVSSYLLRRSEGDDKRSQFASQITQQVELISILADAMQIVARANGEAIPLHLVNLNDMVLMLGSTILLTFGIDGLPIEFEMAADAPLIMGNHILLRQTLIILLDKALRHSHSSDVLTLRTYERGAYGVIEIDDGVDWLPNGDGTADAPHNVGLTFAQRIAQMHQGQFEIVHDGGHGIVRLALPLTS